MGKVNKVEKMGRVKGVEKIEKVREMEKAIEEISKRDGKREQRF